MCYSFFNSLSFIDLSLSYAGKLSSEISQIWMHSWLNISLKLSHYFLCITINNDSWEFDDFLHFELGLPVFVTGAFEVEDYDIVQFGHL